MYARGMTVRDIQAHPTDMYGVEVSRDPISRVTDEVVEELRAWQQRPLEEVYPTIWPASKIGTNGNIQSILSNR
jgi:putative transposase